MQVLPLQLPLLLILNTLSSNVIFFHQNISFGVC